LQVTLVTVNSFAKRALNVPFADGTTIPSMIAQLFAVKFELADADEAS
jgi:hypothetical protein